MAAQQALSFGNRLMNPNRKDIPLIEMRGITKSFGAVQALRGADLKLMPNEVLGLVGDNAAGKSTLMKTLTGVHRPDSGELFFEGKPVIFDSPRASRAHGIEMIYQNLAEWRTIFKQRTSIKAHPQMRELMVPLLEELKLLIPVIFDDINYGRKS